MAYILNYQSGMQAVLHKMEDSFTVSIGVFVNVGSAFESKEENGYSHLVEHMLFKGTKKRSAKKISELSESIGAEFNAFTSKDSTCFYVKCLKDDLKQCLELLSDIFFNSVFPEIELASEKKVVLEEISMTNDVPDEVCYELAAEAIFLKQKLGQSVSGSIENVKNVDRARLLDFKNRFYVAKNVVISLAGNFEEKTVDKLLEDYFESNFIACQGTRSQEDAVHYTYTHLEKITESEQCHLSYSFKGLALFDKRIPSARILCSLLGGSMSSRLFQSVREKRGLAYSVYSFLPSYSKGGYLQIYCGTNTKNVAKVNSLIQSELERIVSGGITEKEVERTKAQSVKGLLMSLESNKAVMSFNARRLLKSGELFDLQSEMQKLKEVSLEDVNKTCRYFFEDNHFATSYVGRASSSIY